MISSRKFQMRNAHQRKGLINFYRKPTYTPRVSCNISQIPNRHSSHVVKNGLPFRMAVLGSGPAGFYTAYKVMLSIENAVVDMYEYLPVPFGLVRFGVAPDHPEVKVSELTLLNISSILLQRHLGWTRPYQRIYRSYFDIIFPELSR